MKSAARAHAEASTMQAEVKAYTRRDAGGAAEAKAHKAAFTLDNCLPSTFVYWRTTESIAYICRGCSEEKTRCE
jgi:hypothetical protein